MKLRLFFGALLLAHFLLLFPLTGYLKQRPIAVKLGFLFLKPPREPWIHSWSIVDVHSSVR